VQQVTVVPGLMPLAPIHGLRPDLSEAENALRASRLLQPNTANVSESGRHLIEIEIQRTDRQNEKWEMTESDPANWPGMLLFVAESPLSNVEHERHP
jgi:hypothetical protein